MARLRPWPPLKRRRRPLPASRPRARPHPLPASPLASLLNFPLQIPRSSCAFFQGMVGLFGDFLALVFVAGQGFPCKVGRPPTPRLPTPTPTPTRPRPPPGWILRRGRPPQEGLRLWLRHLRNPEKSTFLGTFWPPPSNSALAIAEGFAALPAPAGLEPPAPSAAQISASPSGSLVTMVMLEEAIAGVAPYCLSLRSWWSLSPPIAEVTTGFFRVGVTGCGFIPFIAEGGSGRHISIWLLKVLICWHSPHCPFGRIKLHRSLLLRDFLGPRTGRPFG